MNPERENKIYRFRFYSTVSYFLMNALRFLNSSKQFEKQSLIRLRLTPTKNVTNIQRSRLSKKNWEGLSCKKILKA